MDFFKGFIIAGIISIMIWYGVIKTAYNIGYSAGQDYEKSIQGYRFENVPSFASEK